MIDFLANVLGSAIGAFIAIMVGVVLVVLIGSGQETSGRPGKIGRG